ncbi:ATP-binding protein [Thermoflexus sp.]|uniref:Dph6-related ATP pyrophosphatase n=1 Tax=Thermoflexus sp. TaxID=1969742 RepID=UPI0035E439EF
MIALAWSGGKDSVMALHALRQRGEKVAGLLVTLNEAFDRVSMHGVRRSLIHAQAAALGLPVYEVWLPNPCPNEVYEQRMAEAVRRLMQRGIRRFAFGDLFLEEIRAYRLRHLLPLGVEVLFPLWGEPTRDLVQRFLFLGFQAITVCVDGRRLGPSFLGRVLDLAFLADLPADVDPAGENGEFHTFVFNGPGFHQPVAFAPGEVVFRDGFWFQDLIPLRR